MIPKIIHYCWFGKNPIPEKDRKCIESWKRFCPNYEIIEWNEDNFDINCCDYVRQAYEAKKWAFVSDYARLKIIYEYGGIYLDTDVELIKPLDSLLSYASFFGFESYKNINTGLGFGAVQNNSIVKILLNDYSEIPFKMQSGEFDMTPCPERNTASLLKLGLKQNNKFQKINGDNAFYPTEYFCPIDYLTGKKHITKNTIAIHWYNASWQSDEEKRYHILNARLSRIFGVKLSDNILGIYYSAKDEGIIKYMKKRMKKINAGIFKQISNQNSYPDEKDNSLSNSSSDTSCGGGR